MFDNFKADILRHTKNNQMPWRERAYVLFEQGLWAVAVYRFGREAQKSTIPIVSHLLKIIAFILFKLIEITTGICLPASAEIGKGFYIGHFGTIILHKDTKMGEHCSIGPGVLIGTRGDGSSGVPVIGSHVYIGTGAKVLGGIKIGNHVKIGAQALVIHDVPDHTTVVGVPAKPVGRN